MWVRKRLDIRWSDMLFATAQCLLPRGLLPRGRRLLQQEVERSWSPAGDTLACLSVRSGFDLLLDQLQLPASSEVLVSAANLADMTRIIEHHGLVPVPVDLDVRRMAPTAEQLGRAVTPATRAILVAHLFGSRVPMDPIVEIAKQHELFLIEDCAQVFDGGDYRGHPESGAIMFSFGPVKTSTAMGGGLLTIRDQELLRRMQSRQEAYPVQKRAAYYLRLLKYSVMKGGSSQIVFGTAVGLCRMLGRDYDRLIGKAARGFPGAKFFKNIRRQPSAPLLAVLGRRLRTFDFHYLAERTARGTRLRRLLPTEWLCPAADVIPNTFWAFPVVVEKPEQVIAALAAAGFDATAAHHLSAGQPPTDRPELDPKQARDALAKMIYLPCYPEMPERALEEMAQALQQALGKTGNEKAEPSASAHSTLPGEIV